MSRSPSAILLSMTRLLSLACALAAVPIAAATIYWALGRTIGVPPLALSVVALGASAVGYWTLRRGGLSANTAASGAVAVAALTFLAAVAIADSVVN